jgi:hypothetical protein
MQDLDLENTSTYFDLSNVTVSKNDKAQFIKKLQVTDEEILEIMNLDQRSPKWKHYRRGRLTASNFGKAAGHDADNGNTREKLLKEMLWPKEFTNDAMEHGTRNEATAFSDAYITLHDKYKSQGASCIVFEPIGLVIDKEHPYLGASADGMIKVFWPDGSYIVGNAEIKCPYYKKEFYPITPHPYYDQFQGQSAICGKQLFDKDPHINMCKGRVIEFIMWFPHKHCIRTYEPDVNYWNTELLPKLQQFYFDMYIPAAILKERGHIQPGEIAIKPVF